MSRDIFNWIGLLSALNISRASVLILSRRSPMIFFPWNMLFTFSSFCKGFLKLSNFLNWPWHCYPMRYTSGFQDAEYDLSTVQESSSLFPNQQWILSVGHFCISHCDHLSAICPFFDSYSLRPSAHAVLHCPPWISSRIHSPLFSLIRDNTAVCRLGSGKGD